MYIFFTIGYTEFSNKGDVIHLKKPVYFCLTLCLLTPLFALRPVRVQYLSPEFLAGHVSDIVKVKVLNTRTERIGQIVYTDAICQVLENIKGPLRNQNVVIRQPGGKHGDILTDAGPIPPFRKEQQWLLCLERPPQGWLTVSGFKQGAFRLEKGRANREFSGFIFDKPPPDSVKNGIESIDENLLLKRLLSSVKTTPPANAVAEYKAIQQAIPEMANPRSNELKPEANDDDKDNKPFPFVLIISALGLLILVSLVFKTRKSK